MEDKVYMNNEGEYGKYIVQDLQTPPNMYNEEFARMYEKFSHRILWMDGNVVPASALTDSEMDIVAYLDKDDDGKITRGTWHEIEIVPNGLTRIEANLFVQAFVQSVGGGDY